MRELTTPKKVLMVMGFLNVVVVLMIIIKIITGVPAESLSGVSQELEQITAQGDVSEEQAIENRTQRLEATTGLDGVFRQDVHKLVEDRDYDAFEATYGPLLRGVLEQEFENRELTDVKVYNRTVNHTEGITTYLVDINADVFVYIEYNIAEDLWEPLYTFTVKEAA